MKFKTYDDFVNEKLSFEDTEQGIQINNPFTTVGGMKDVDPAQEYGKDYAKSKTKKAVDAIEEFVSAWDEYKTTQPMGEEHYLTIDEFMKDKLVKIQKAIK